MPTLSLTLTSPDSSNSDITHPRSIQISGNINEPSVLRCEYSSEYDPYDDDVISSLIQRNSSVILRRDGVIIWRGRIYNWDRREASGIKTQSFEAIDPLIDLQYGAAYLGGSHLGSMRSTEVALAGSMSMTALTSGTGRDTDKWYYPDPSTYAGAYYPITSSPRTVNTTTAGVNDSDLTIPTTATADEYFPREGLIKINSEYIYYTGYGYSTGSSRFVFTAGTNGRGAFGSTAAAHALNDGIDLIQFNRISPFTAIRVYDGLGILTPGQDYTVNYEAGRIEIDSSYTVTSTITAEYKVFDETAATGVRLGGNGTYGAIDQLLIGGWGNGAPEFDGASGRPSYHLSTSSAPTIDDIRLGYVDLQGVVTAREAIDALIDRYQHTSVIDGCESLPIGMWFDHAENKLYIGGVKTTGATVIRNHSAVSYRYEMGDVYTDVVTVYRSSDDQDTAEALHVRTVATGVTSSGLYYDGTNYTKYRAGGDSAPRTAIIDQGAESRGRAASAANDLLRESYKLNASRSYEFTEIDSGAIPWVGDVYEFQDGYIGYVTSATYGVSGQVEQLELTAVDTR